MTEYVRPGDLLHVLKPMDPVTGFRFTRDRDGRPRAIERFEGRKGDYAPRTPFETQYLRPDTRRRRERPRADRHHRPARADDEDGGAAAGAGRARADQRGIRPRRRRRAPAAARLAEPGARRQPLQPADLHARPARPRAAAGRRGAPPADRGLDTLQSLAEQTGGEAISDGRELLPALARLSRDLDSYYVLTYQPSQATDGRFHPITVRTHAEGRADPRAVRLLVAAQQRVAHLAGSRLGAGSARQAGPHASPQPVDRHLVWLRARRRRRGWSCVFTWEPTAAGAALRARPAGRDAEGVDAAGRAPCSSARSRRSGAPGSSGARTARWFAVPPGRMQLDLSVRAADGSVIDTSAQDIDVPAVRGTGPVLLQPQLRAGPDGARLPRAVGARRRRAVPVAHVQPQRAAADPRAGLQSGWRRGDDLGVGLQP